MKKNKKLSLFMILGYAFLVVLLMLVAFPFAYAFICSFKNTSEILIGTKFLPEKFMFSNYVKAWTIANFKQYTWNSIWYTILCMIGPILTSAMGGYVFSRGNFAGKNIVFNTFLGLMFVVLGTSSLYPKLEILNILGLGATLWGSIVMHFFGVNAANTFLVRGFVNSIPKSLDEAAKIDGCGFFTTFLNIILPMLKPILATVAILAFTAAWNDYLIPMILTISTPEKQTLAVGMIALKSSSEAATAWNLILAGAMMSAVPMIIVYLAFNKYFTTGVTAGAVKG